MVLLDANVLVYFLDETADRHMEVISTLQRLVDESEQPVTSHHIIEEVLFVLSKYDSSANLGEAVERISCLPDLILIEPPAHLDFAKRYVLLSHMSNMGLNDVLLLQLMLDAGIKKLFSYDKKFADKSAAAGINIVS
jgi:predicted nucleic acid-binding protein